MLIDGWESRFPAFGALRLGKELLSFSRRRFERWEIAVKVIFLDVDGVLVSREGFQKAQFSATQTVIFDKTALTNLKTLVDATGAKPVITSSWRPYTDQRPTMSYLWLKSVMAHNGTLVYDETPRLTGHGIDRSDEIAAWLAAHDHIESYVVIDDNDRLWHHPEIRCRLVRTDPDFGIREDTVQQALHLLNDETV